MLYFICDSMKALVYGVKNSIYEIIYFILYTLTSIFIRKLLIENINIEVVALQQVLHQIITIVTLIEFGISNILVFYLYPAIKRGNKSKVSNIMNSFKKKYILIAGTAFILGLVMIPFLSFFVNDFKTPLNYILIYLIMLIQNVSILLFSYKKFLLQADQKSYIYLRIMIIYKLLYLLVAYLIIKFTNNCYIYYAILCLSEILTYITISKVVDKKYDYIKKDAVNEKAYDKEIVKHIKSTGVSKVFSELTSSIDIFVISFMSNGYNLGLYTNYFSIFTSIYLIVMKIFDSFKATVAKYMDSNSLDYSFQVFKLFEVSGYVMSLLVAVVFYVTIDFLITIWLGSKYILSNSIPLLLSIQLFFYIHRMSLWNTIGINGWFSISKVSDFLGTTINLVLSIILYSKLEIPGVILATIIAQVVQYIIETHHILKEFNQLNLKVIFDYILYIIFYIIILISIVNKCIFLIPIIVLGIIYLLKLIRGRYKYVFKN